MSKTALSSAFLALTIVAVLFQHTQAKYRAPRSTVNEYIVKERAWRLSCQRHNCTVLHECRNQRGWSIWGSDIGCCGNYQGCCKLASIVCWAHDIFCRCCEYGMFVCGPLCTKDLDCPAEEGSGEIHVMNDTDEDENVKDDEEIGVTNETGITEGETIGVKNDTDVPNDGETHVKNDTDFQNDGETHVKSDTDVLNDGETLVKNDTLVPDRGETEVKNDTVVPNGGETHVVNVTAILEDKKTDVVNDTDITQGGNSHVMNDTDTLDSGVTGKVMGKV